MQKQTISQNELQKHFDNLFDRKIQITNYIQTTYFKDFAKDIKIKKDIVTKDSIKPKIVNTLNSYNEILSKVIDVINNNLQTYELEPIFQAHQVLKDILTTKIIKNGKLNPQSNKLIEKANELK